MKKYLILLIISTLFSEVKSQPLSIWVFDDQKQPIVGTIVQLLPQNIVGTTDTSGRCVLNKPPKVTRLKIQSVGYQTWQQTLSDTTTELTFLLHPDDHTLGEVVVSATLKDMSKSDAPIPIEVFTARFFQKNVSATLFESLSGVNGVRPQLNCNVCNTGDIRINGMDGPYTMVTIDGMPIVSGLSTVYGLNGIPNGLIERVEIVKGPAGTLYGSEAVGGLINIVTKNAQNAPRWAIETFASHVGEWNTDIGLSAKTKRAQTLLGINTFYFQNKLDINNDNFTDMALQKRVSIFNKWQFNRPNNRLATLAARYVQEDRWGGQLNWSKPWRGTDSLYGESIYTHRLEVLSKYQLPLKNRFVALDASWNSHWQDAFYGTTPYVAAQHVGFLQLTSDLNWGKNHEVLVGGATRFTHYNDNTPATATPSVVWLPGVFFQDNIHIKNKMQLLIGSRLDYNTTHGIIFTPRLSWKWPTTANHVWRFTTGSGYRVAQVFTEDHAALTGARTVVMAENLRPERSWNAHLNHTFKIYPKGIGFINVDASLFYTYFTNRILPDYTSDPEKIIYANLDGHAVSSGAALNLELNALNGLKATAGATAMSIYRVDKGQRQPQLFAPAFTANWSVGYNWTRARLKMDYTGQLNSPMYLPVFPNDPRPEQSPWFAIHNIQFTKSFGTHFDLYIGVKNLLGFFPKETVILRAFDPFDKYIHINNPQQFTFDPSYNYAPIQRQRVQIGFRWKLDFDKH